MYEKFTDSAKRVMRWANHEADKGNQTHMAPEHIFFGLLIEGGTGVQILSNLDVDLDAVLEKTEEQLPVSPVRPPPGSQPPPDAVAKRVIESAIAEAQALNRNVDTEHLLLGLVLTADCAPAQMLAPSGVTAEKIRELLLKVVPGN